MKLILDQEQELDLKTSIKNYQRKEVLSISGDGYLTEDSIINAKEPSELADVIKELNEDSISQDLKMSKIDMKSRLHPIEISAILCVDTLVSMEFLPESCLPFTRQKKRLAVSSGGAGRDDIVKIVAGKRELDKDSTGQNIFQKMGGFFTGK